MEFFCAKSQTFCIRSHVMRADFSKTFGEAVRRRTYPNTGLHLSQLAYSVGCHVETMKNAVRGQHNLSSHLVAGCIDFFAKAGDASFLCELYPNAVTPLLRRAEEADKAIKFTSAITSAFKELGAGAVA